MSEPKLQQSTISMPEGETVGSHKFPWKPSEIVGLALVGGAGLGIMAMSDFAAGSVLFGGALLAVIPYFVWLSNSRKKKSLISVIQQGERWLFTKRGIHDSSDSNVTADVSRIAHIDVVDYTGMPNALVFLEAQEEAGTRKALAVPSRMLRDGSFRGRVHALASSPDVTVSAKAKTLIGIN